MHSGHSDPSAPPVPLAAIVPAGGRARRLGGRDKPMVEVAGVPMLRAVVTAALAADASPCVVVGPPRDGLGLPGDGLGLPGDGLGLPRDGLGLPAEGRVVFVREEPAGGGPVAAIAAGLALVGGGGLVAVLAGDMPFLSEAAVRALVAAVGDGDGAVFVDEDGRRQLLCGVWRTDALAGAVRRLGVVEGASLRSLVADLTVSDLTWDGGRGRVPYFDCDTEDDLRCAAAETGPASV